MDPLPPTSMTQTELSVNDSNPSPPAYKQVTWVRPSSAQSCTSPLCKEGSSAHLMGLTGGEPQLS